jgi:muramoyltetrapeptide carboxypeptidase LdcA involved in peptidoglycan recycling
MMKNILILKNNLLYSTNGEKVSKESITFLLDINEQYFLIDKSLEQVNESSFRNERDFHSDLDLL